MDTDRKLLRLAAAMMLGVLAVYLLGNGRLPKREEVIQTILFLQTGRLSQPTEPEEIPTEPATEATVEVSIPQETTPPKVVLTAKDVAAVAIHNQAGISVNVEAMMQRMLDWQLRKEEPTVLILHTHGTESYRNTEGYSESTQYRTEDENYNMISVGSRLAAWLEAGGIRVIHDKTPYDLPSYSGSYAQAREAIETVLAENPSVCLVLDLHRDAMTDAQGNQMAYTCQTERGTAAKLMLVSGSDAGGLPYPDWEKNLTLAVKLQAVLERQEPGICRSLSFRTGRYNQDLFPNMVLVEVGAAGNSRQEALLAVEFLAEAILAMAEGTEYK